MSDGSEQMSRNDPTEQWKADGRREREILDAWALRFDGYAFEATTGFGLARGNDRWTDRGIMPRDPLRRLAVLFAMQRWLGKWSGEYQPRHGRAWRRFRELFLKTTEVAVPERYRFGGRYEEWERDRLPNAAEDVAFVAKIHATTAYDDDAQPTL